MLLTYLFTAATFLIFWLCLKHLFHLRKWDHIPGYTSWSSFPLAGHAYLLRKPYQQLIELHKKFGPVMRFDYGPVPTVFISDYDLAVEAYSGDALLGRPTKLLPGYALLRGKESSGEITGVTFSQGRTWHEGRKFMLQHVNNFVTKGRGGVELEDLVREEAIEMLEFFKDLVGPKGTNICLNGKFNVFIANIIRRMITGDRHSIKDPKLIHITRMLAKQHQQFQPDNILTLLQLRFPFFVRLFEKLGLESSCSLAMKDITAALKDAVDTDVADKDGNYVERFNAEISSEKPTDSPFSLVNGKTHLAGTVYDLFLAGTDTSTAFIEWTLLYMAREPEKQERAYKEIHEKIGDRFPKVSDKEDLYFIVAALHEGFRHARSGSFNVPHMSTRDFTLGGFFIPKDTQVFVNFGAIRRSSDYFENPGKFDPDRFLTPEGKFTGLDEHISLFGIGRRKCVAERLALSTTFLFLVSIIQSFSLHELPSDPIDIEDYDMGGVLATPKPVKIEMRARY